jgi:hypothetical protein
MTYEEAVRLLADWHLEGEDPPIALYHFPDPERLVIRFIEVTNAVPETGALFPIAFAPTEELPFRTVIAQVTEGEWQQIIVGTIPLPQGWALPGVEVTRAAVGGLQGSGGI